MFRYLDDPLLFFDGCSWVPCLFWTVKLSTVLQKNPPCPAESSVFQHLLHIWTLSSSDCMILRSIFSHWGQLRDSNATIKKGSNLHWCSWRKYDELRSGGWKLFEFEDQGKLNLICLQGNKYLLLLPKGSTKWEKNIFLQNKKNLDIFILFKSFHPLALNTSYFLQEHQWMFEPFYIYTFMFYMYFYTYISFIFILSLYY